MLMLHLDSIRDVIAFPKTQSAIDPLTQAPSVVADKQLKELHIKTALKKEKEKDLFAKPVDRSSDRKEPRSLPSGFFLVHLL